MSMLIEQLVLLQVLLIKLKKIQTSVRWDSQCVQA